MYFHEYVIIPAIVLLFRFSICHLHFLQKLNIFFFLQNFPQKLQRKHGQLGPNEKSYRSICERDGGRGSGRTVHSYCPVWWAGWERQGSTESGHLAVEAPVLPASQTDVHRHWRKIKPAIKSLLSRSKYDCLLFLFTTIRNIKFPIDVH